MTGVPMQPDSQDIEQDSSDEKGCMTVFKLAVAIVENFPESIDWESEEDIRIKTACGVLFLLTSTKLDAVVPDVVDFFKKEAESRGKGRTYDQMLQEFRSKSTNISFTATEFIQNNPLDAESAKIEIGRAHV